jgi:hypothetical protein
MKLNKIEEFEDGSEWTTPSGKKLKFHSIFHFEDRPRPIFTCDEEHSYFVFDENDDAPNGTIGFFNGWEILKKIEI